MLRKIPQEKSACGVGFVANLKQNATFQTLQQALAALACQEHRGACGADRITGDGSGLMTDIPFELFAPHQAGQVAVAMLFAPAQPEKRRQVLEVFEQVFDFMGLKVLAYREVPTNPAILGKDALARMPYIVQAFIQRPAYCNTNGSFDKLLYNTKQLTRTKLQKAGLPELFFASLSAQTIVYKALTRAEDLGKFYLDLQNPLFKTRFGLFHRRFSTNTTTTWDRVQPFRLIGHNGEFNTITGNRSWAISRERALGLYEGELITAEGISDSGSLNEMIEALKYRSSIPYLREVMAILMPPATKNNAFYEFWSRAMEPWDGPALVLYSNGRSIGARLDRNGFRPCRWVATDDNFYLSSEAGSFHLDERTILAKGTLQAGTGINVDLRTGKIDFTDPSHSRENYDAQFDKRTFKLAYQSLTDTEPQYLHKKYLFGYTQEDYNKILFPMITEGKEPIGSMGDTARPAIFSAETRSFFDYFYHNFAQVTNPPLDYLREKNVTDLTTYLGKRPNIFAKKELLPAPIAFELPSPILSLGQMKQISVLTEKSLDNARIIAQEIDFTFTKAFGVVGFLDKLESIAQQAKEAVEKGVSLLVLTDRYADYDHPAMPALLALRAVVSFMRDSGLRLNFSVIVHSAEVRSTHQVACIVGMGAAAVCPYLALEVARFEQDKDLAKLSPDEKEQNLLKAYENGLLKIMSKMGISVVRSYHSSLLFSSFGLNEALIQQYFYGVTPVLGGIGIPEIVQQIILQTERARHAEQAGQMLHTYQYKEHNKGLMGEKHSMTNAKSKIIHDLVRKEGLSLDDMQLYKQYLELSTEDNPVSIRHLLTLKSSNRTLPPNLSMDETLWEGEVQPRSEILRTFGSGAMSFGAISAEAQRDIFYAMREIGGRSNSGEGGENPYYHIEGITASAKQIASARFGVNALYLVSGDEVQIKVAQGAKPGEGGQLMGIKVDVNIAKARNAMPGVDLISPPPLHDIYSIEDLKQLIYEIKQLKPEVKVNVKLVSGAGIGTIAVGVAKAGADIIHISGGDGGTGAAPLSSMKYAGLPWEYGLLEVHRALLDNQLRHTVKLRTDGGLQTGLDIVLAAILGAEEFDFGKLLLVAQGCVMARICEKNTCPTGIATHDPRFKAKYKGSKEHIVKMLQLIAEDVRRYLHYLGTYSLSDLVGKTHLLALNPEHLPLVQAKQLDLGFILDEELPYTPASEAKNPFTEGIDPLNAQIWQDVKSAVAQNQDIALAYPIQVTNRATLAHTIGQIALLEHYDKAAEFLPASVGKPPKPYQGKIAIDFTGSAGQGFGVFLTPHFEVRLFGEANDSVCKSMSGGKVIIRPHTEAKFKAEDNVIIGNVALYGATGGTLYVSGLAADRFSVRNSGATAVVEGVGLHACEYMTRGQVVILGNTSYNIGGGMTGGEVIIYGKADAYVNHEYLAAQPMTEEELQALKALLEDYLACTQSRKAAQILQKWEKNAAKFSRYKPLSLLRAEAAVLVPVEAD